MGTTKQRALPKGRRYSAEEKAQAVRLVRTLRDELATSHGTVAGRQSARLRPRERASLGASGRRRRRTNRRHDDRAVAPDRRARAGGA